MKYENRLRVPLQDRTGQIIVDEADVMLIVGRGVYPSDPYVSAWSLISLLNYQEYILSEDWVAAQAKMGKLVSP